MDDEQKTADCRANLADDARLRTYEDYAALRWNAWLQVTDEKPFGGYYASHSWAPYLDVGSGDGVKRIGYRRSDGAGFVLPTPGGRWWTSWVHPFSSTGGWHHHAFGSYADGHAAAMAFDIVYELERLAGNTDRCKDAVRVDRTALEKAIEEKLWDMICSAGGDGDSIREMAKEIADLRLDANRKAD